MVVLGTTTHEFACSSEMVPNETRGWSDQVRPWRIGEHGKRKRL